MLIPGDHYVGSPVTVAINLQDANGDDLDPDTLVFKIFSPAGVTTTYTYADGDEIVRQDAGDYYIDVTPDQAGRWFYRWSTTGTNKTIALEGNFVVKASVFYDDPSRDAYRP